jgi:hypothetical protein
MRVQNSENRITDYRYITTEYSIGVVRVVCVCQLLSKKDSKYTPILRIGYELN